MKVVIFAGGTGTRLKPYTTSFPKPLMPLGDKPILEIEIRQLVSHGFTDIVISVGHLAELITAFFDDGKKFGAKITYIRENKPLGTAGALGLLKETLTDTFLTMNGDELSRINYADIIGYHQKNQCVATVGIAKRNVYVDFGVIELDTQNRIEKWIEKPNLNYLVSMGINVFEPEVLEYIEPNKRLDIPDLFKMLIEDGKCVKGYVYEGEWLDIGRPEDYETACREMKKYIGGK